MLAIITDPGIGGTFLSWTIYYLSGREEYFSIRNQSVIKIPDSPLTSKNAHAFSVNQARNIEELDQFLPTLLDKNESLYIHQFRNHTQQAVSTLCNAASKTVVLALPMDYALYRCKYEVRHNVAPAWGSDQKLSTAKEIHEDFINHFFNDSKSQWESANLNEVWDQREFMALNFNFFNLDSILNYINYDHSYYHINPVDLWTSFDCSVRELFDYLDIEIDENRYTQWTAVYSQWKKNHLNRLRFVWYFDTIVSNILNNVDFDLTRLDLDLHQESAIQHVLIYKHNLNLKTWQLIKFTNTKQLHNLLEPNIHDLSKSLIGRLTA